LFDDADPVWVAECHLTVSNRKLVRRGWLNDKIIDAVYSMVSAKLDGRSQTTLLAQSTAGFEAYSTEIVTTLYSNSHWVTLACLHERITYSMTLHQPPTLYVRRQILRLFPRSCQQRWYELFGLWRFRCGYAAELAGRMSMGCALRHR